MAVLHTTPLIVNEMLVSVIIPVYNRAAVVGRTLESVLAQTYRPLEVIVVDNDSSDGSREVLERFAAEHDAPDFRVVVASCPHHMAGAPRNRGAELAHGEWLVFFDSDDEMKPRLIEEYVKVVNRHGGELDLVSTRDEVHYADGRVRRLSMATPGGGAEGLMPYHILNGQLATLRYAIRRDFFAGTDGWNISVPVWNDWELGVRLLLAGPRVAYMKKTLVVVHDSGATSITGTAFSSRAGLWEHVLDIGRLHIMLAAGLDEATRRYWLRLVEFKRLALAADYEREGRDDLARALCRKAYSALRQSYGDSLGWRWVKAPLTRWLFRRMASGGRGSSHIARLIY